MDEAACLWECVCVTKNQNKQKYICIQIHHGGWNFNDSHWQICTCSPSLSLTHSHRISFHVKLCIQFCMHKSFLCIHKNAFYLFLVAGVDDDFFLNLEMHFLSTFFLIKKKLKNGIKKSFKSYHRLDLCCQHRRQLHIVVVDDIKKVLWIRCAFISSSLFIRL